MELKHCHFLLLIIFQSLFDKLYSQTCNITSEFQCTSRGSFSSECIPITFQCDRLIDCEFGDDEWNCPGCEQDGFICPGTGDCIPNTWQCDSIWDCPQQEDELLSTCPDETANCLELSDSFQCTNTNGRCLLSIYVCNGIDSDGCLDNQDEETEACFPDTLTLVPTRNPTNVPTNIPTKKKSNK